MLVKASEEVLCAFGELRDMAAQGWGLGVK